jgi:hypothetical protein
VICDTSFCKVYVENFVVFLTILLLIGGTTYISVGSIDPNSKISDIYIHISQILEFLEVDLTIKCFKKIIKGEVNIIKVT